jgi:ABC-type transport system involved in multi-copper enzyme maturation permease subunit
MEAIRRKILVVFVIFIVLSMFAGWLLDLRTDHPAQLYITFVLSATNLLVLLLGLFISTFSLPADIKNRTIYTIVTKPVRATEIVIGRIIGFSLIGSMILAVLGLFSYIFVVRGLNHTHDVVSISQDGRQGKTGVSAVHDHTFKLQADGKGVTSEAKGHQHTVTAVEVDGKTTYRIGPPIGELTAKVPIFGSLTYTDRMGNVSAGLNVGYMSEYRKFIAGGTLSSAKWQFEGVRESDFPDGLVIEMNIEAFRTYKGDIVTPVRGSIILRSPDESVETQRRNFLVKESVDRHTIPLQVSGFRNNQPATLDIFKDIVMDGRLEVIVRCEDSQQYLGMAASDLTLQAGERSFAWNFAKGYINIWLQMVIVICFGVMFSTFLSGPVAMVATLSTLGLGLFGSQIDQFFKAEYSGGGPIESVVRIVTQKGVMLELDLGNEALEKTIRNIDYVLMYGVSSLKSALPNFSRLGTSDFVVYGVDLFDSLLLRNFAITFGFFLLTSFIGYFFFKTREMAA